MDKLMQKFMGYDDESQLKESFDFNRYVTKRNNMKTIIVKFEIPDEILEGYDDDVIDEIIVEDNLRGCNFDRVGFEILKQQDVGADAELEENETDTCTCCVCQRYGRTA